MNMLIKRNKRATETLKKGFSLIEIMFVIMIIGILAAAAFGGFKYVQQAKLSQTNSKLLNLDTALERYLGQIGEFPEDLQELIDGPHKPTRKWQSAFVEAADLKDSWGNPFAYQRTSNNSYELESKGAKGTEHIFSPRSQNT